MNEKEDLLERRESTPQVYYQKEIKEYTCVVKDCNKKCIAIGKEGECRTCKEVLCPPCKEKGKISEKTSFCSKECATTLCDTCVEDETIIVSSCLGCGHWMCQNCTEKGTCMDCGKVKCKYCIGINCSECNIQLCLECAVKRLEVEGEGKEKIENTISRISECARCDDKCFTCKRPATCGECRDIICNKCKNYACDACRKVLCGDDDMNGLFECGVCDRVHCVSCMGLASRKCEGCSKKVCMWCIREGLGGTEMQKWVKMEHVVKRLEKLDKRLRGEGKTWDKMAKERKKEIERWESMEEEEKIEEKKKQYEKWKKRNELAKYCRKFRCYCPKCEELEEKKDITPLQTFTNFLQTHLSFFKPV